MLCIEAPELLVGNLENTYPEVPGDLAAHLRALVELACRIAHDKLTGRYPRELHRHAAAEVNGSLERPQRLLAGPRFYGIERPAGGFRRGRGKFVDLLGFDWLDLHPDDCGRLLRIDLRPAIQLAQFVSPPPGAVRNRPHVAPRPVTRSVQVGPRDNPIPRLTVKPHVVMPLAEYLDKFAGVGVVFARSEHFNVVLDVNPADVRH